MNAVTEMRTNHNERTDRGAYLIREHFSEGIALRLEKQAEGTRLKPDCERLSKEFDFILSVIAVSTFPLKQCYQQGE